MATKNPFDKAVRKLKTEAQYFKGYGERCAIRGSHVDSPDTKNVPSDKIVCDGNNIHLNDGIPLFDPEIIRGIKDELFIIGDND